MLQIFTYVFGERKFLLMTHHSAQNKKAKKKALQPSQATF